MILQSCELLHISLSGLPLIRFPLNIQGLPDDGIYFFYEEGENWGHGEQKPRMVRVGTHREGNFKSRINDHFVLNEPKMGFAASSSAPKDRSIFRKNIGRAILNKHGDTYLSIWEIDFTTKKNRELYADLRDVNKERSIEGQVTEILRGSFQFRFIVLDGQTNRMGASGLERRLIGSLRQCAACRPSEHWLGHSSPKSQIRASDYGWCNI